MRLPKSLVDEVDALVGRHGFTSRAEVVKEAVRSWLLEQHDRGTSDDLDTVRIQIVKAMLDEFPEVRKFAKGYLKFYHDEG